MKRTVIAGLAACAIMAAADVGAMLVAFYGLPDETPIFLRVALALGPGFLALGGAYLWMTPRSRAHLPVALALLLLRFLLLDSLFAAPKRAELDRDAGLLRSANQPLSKNYYEAAGTIYQATLAAGSGCLAGAALVFGIASRRRNPAKRWAEA